MSAAAAATTPVVYTPLAIRRITRDTAAALDLAEHGLFWIPSDDQVGHGWAVVMGPEGTPYDGGAFCFEVRFPGNYPFEPPVFTYLTNDGRTRFNPNLYKSGKVCLSLLNTWQGEPWSGVQSLGSVLQCLQASVLVDEPLKNEPGYSGFTTHTDFEPYKRMVFHSVLQTAVLRNLTEPPEYLVPVYDAMASWVERARPRLLAKARALGAAWDGKTETMSFFQMTQKYRFAELAAALERLSLAPRGGAGGAATEGDCEF
jgi:ubiquitin-protein ligase